MRTSLFAPQRVQVWRGLGWFAWNRAKIRQWLHWKQSTLFWRIFPTRMTKPSNVRAATAWNINNMNMGPILRHAALYPLHPGIKFSPWKCVNFANTSLPTLYYEISGCFRIGQNFHISAHFHHFATLVKCISGYRLQLLITSLTIFWRYTGAFWKIRKVLRNPNYPLKSFLDQ